MKVIAVLLLGTILGGCASSDFGRASSGGAVYEYTKTQEGCTVRATSSREIAGANISVSDNCEFTATVDELAAPYADVMNGLIKLIPVQ